MPSRLSNPQKIVRDVKARATKAKTLLAVVECLLTDKDVSAVLNDNDHDYVTSLEVCKNLRASLQEIKWRDRYSGGVRGILSAATYGKGFKTRIAQLLKVHRNTLYSAVSYHDCWTEHRKSIVLKTHLIRCRKPRAVPDYIRQWIKDNTTPSSNTRNTLVTKIGGQKVRHVIHWRTETFNKMYQACQVEVANRFGVLFKKSYFHKLVPENIRIKKHQEGLCPTHHTGLSLAKELKRKRVMWHKHCTCTCEFCSDDGCNHGRQPEGDGDCHLRTCTRCADVRCPKEWCNTNTQWYTPVQQKRVGGGLYWVDEEMQGTRKEMMRYMNEEMDTYNTHNEHVRWHKAQIARLLEVLVVGMVFIKCDFIQNIVHSRGRETSNSYYGKRQTQLLSFSVWFFATVNGEDVRQKLYVDYLSSYLTHSSMYFQKCLVHLLNYLKNVRNVVIDRLWLDTDGGRAHFKSRISFFFATTLPDLFTIIVHWLFAPSHHGKGDCDSHGAVVKKSIKLFVLNDENHVDDEHEAVEFINGHVNNSKAFIMSITADDFEQDCTGLKGSNGHYEFRFTGPEGKVFMRKYPCACDSCFDEDFDNCEHADYAGVFKVARMTSKGKRVPRSRFTDVTEIDDDGNNFVVKSIEGKRVRAGATEYLIAWEGYDDMTWVAADKLSCAELIEEFEVENE